MGSPWTEQRLFAKAAPVLALAFVAACGLPQDVSQDDVRNYEAAVASIGCVLKFESDYLPVELQTGLTREQVQAVTSYQLSFRRAVKLEEGGVKLTTGACAG